MTFLEKHAELAKYGVCKEAGLAAVEKGKDAALEVIDNNRLFRLFPWEREAVSDAIEAHTAWLKDHFQTRRSACAHVIGCAIAAAANKVPA